MQEFHSRRRRRDSLRGVVFQELEDKQTNFSNYDICDVDFTGADLTGAIFTGANIKGANFTEATLTGAIFDGSVFGIKTSWTICIFILFLFLISLSGFSASIIISCISYFYLYPRIRGVIKNISIIFLSTFYITTFHVYWLAPFLKKKFNINEDILIGNLIYIGVCIIFICGVFIPFIKVMDDYKSDKQIFYTILVFSVFLIFINLVFLYNQELLDRPTKRFIGAFLGSILGTIISNLAIKDKNKNYAWIFELFVHVVSIHGNKFYRSTLNDASFLNANIIGSTFVECKAIRTNWKGIKRFDCSRFQVHYLHNPQIRHLLIYKQVGKYNEWQGMDLRGLNLAGAILNGVNLSGADLSNSTLKDAQLIKSNLSHTLLDNVDLSGIANITGAIVGIKSIPPTAKVDGLICKYFYSELNSEQPYPINGELTSEKVIELLQKSSEIILPFKPGGIDWQAFLQSFEKSLREFDIPVNDSESLIQAFERELDGSFGIKLNVPNNIDKQVFKQKLKNEYETVAKKLQRENPNIDFKDDTSFLGISAKIVKCRNLTIYNIEKTENKPMSESSTSNFNQPNSINQNLGTAESGSNIEFNQNNYAAEQKQDLAEAATKIQKLLKQLEQTNPTANDAEKVAYVNEETTPSFKKRVAGAFQAGSETAIDEFILNDKYLKVAKATIKGWIQPNS